MPAKTSSLLTVPSPKKLLYRLQSSCQPAPEGVAYFSKSGLKITGFDPNDHGQFYSYLLLDLALNGNALNANNKSQPRDSDPGKGTPFRTISVMYGRDPRNISRIRKIYQDESKGGKTSEAGFVPIPMPTPSERFFWVDLTYGVCGIYFPLCHAVPGPYRQLCKYVRLDFKHRPIQLPFARPFDLDYYPRCSRDILKVEIEKAKLELCPEVTVRNGILHPYPRETHRFTVGILGDVDGSKKQLFQDLSLETAKRKDALKEWLSQSQFARMTSEEATNLFKLKETAEMFRIERTHKYSRLQIQLVVPNANVDKFESNMDSFELRYHSRLPSILADYVFSDADKLENEFPGTLKELAPGELFELSKVWSSKMLSIPKNTSDRLDVTRGDTHTTVPLRTLMSSPDHDPDAVSFDYLNFQTDVKLGLRFHQHVTLRFDVQELLLLLAIPPPLRKEAKTGARDAEQGQDQPLDDVYNHMLVLAWPSKDVQAQHLTPKSPYRVSLEGFYQEYSMNSNNVINYTAYIQGDFGLDVEYVPMPKTLGQQFLEFFAQLVAVFAELIPGVGPFLGPLIGYLTYTITFALVSPVSVPV